MKKLLFVLASIMMLSCSKINFNQEPSAANVYTSIQDYAAIKGIDVPISKVQIDSCFQASEKRMGANECLPLQNLFDELLPNFGRKYRDLIPSCNNYFQEGMFCSQTRFPAFMYERNSDGTMQWLGNLDLADSIQWYIDSTYVATGPRLQFQVYVGNSCADAYVQECNGNHDLEMRVFFQGVEYRRSGKSFSYINQAPYPSCLPFELVPSWHTTSDTIFYFEPYEFINPETAKGDYTGDWNVNTADLIYLLSHLCLN